MLQQYIKQYPLPITPMPCTIYLAGFKQWAVGNPGDGKEKNTDILLVLVENLVICSSLSFKLSSVIIKSWKWLKHFTHGISIDCSIWFKCLLYGQVIVHKKMEKSEHFVYSLTGCSFYYYCKRALQLPRSTCKCTIHSLGCLAMTSSVMSVMTGEF